MIFQIVSKRYGTFDVIIDDADWPDVKNYKWHVAIQKRRKAIYARRNIYRNGSRTPIEMTLHKQLTGYAMTDHINGNGLDCRRANMRPATVSQNRHNVGIRKDNASGYKGVCFEKSSDRWVARIQIAGKNKTVGRYKTKQQAALAYNVAARKYHGEYAYLNEVTE